MNIAKYFIALVTSPTRPDLSRIRTSVFSMGDGYATEDAKDGSL